MIRVDERILEFQTALSVDAADDYNRSSELKKWAERLKSEWKGKPARSIPCIPENPMYSEL